MVADGKRGRVMTLISLEDAKAEVRKVVSDFRTRYDINYRLNNLPSIELDEEAEQTEPTAQEYERWLFKEPKQTEPSTDCSWK